MTDNASLSQIAVVIPAWKPDEKLLAVVDELARAPLAAIVVINDGSGPDYDALFQPLLTYPAVRLLQHAHNCGTGRAQKTGFQYVLDHMPHLAGVVTADADGQHAPTDVLRVADELAHSVPCPVIGVRIFDPSVPLRSRFGNILTRVLFRLLSGVALQDTQCGLRSYPLAMLPGLIQREGERYEFITSALAHLCRQPHKPRQLPIQTIYLERNRSSHFRPIQDSARIYSLLFRAFLFPRPPRG